MTREPDEDVLVQDRVRALLAAAPLRDPGPERTARWRAAVDEAVDATRVDAEAHRRLGPAPPGRRLNPAAPPGRRPDPAAPPGRRPFRFGGVSVAAAAVVLAVALPAGSAVTGPGGLGPGGTTGTGGLGPGGATGPGTRPGGTPASTFPLVLSRAELPVLAARAFTGGLDGGLDAAGSGSGPGHDSGPLADPVAREQCLAALGVTEPPLGGRAVLLDGRPGVLLVLPTGRAGRLRLLVVPTSCGAGGPAEVLADRLIGP